MVRCCPGAVGFSVAVVGWVAMLVATTSKQVGLMAVSCYISCLVIKHVIMGK